MPRKTYTGPKYLEPGSIVGWHAADGEHRTGTVWSRGTRVAWTIPDMPRAGEAAAIALQVSTRKGCAPTVREAEYGDLADASRADFQRALAEAYRIASADSKAGSVDWLDQSLPAGIHRRAQRLARNILQAAARAGEAMPLAA